MYIPYGRQSIDEKDIKAVEEVLRSDYLTTGPKIEEFERKVAAYTGAKYAVAIACTAGIAHTYIVAEKIQQAATEAGHECKGCGQVLL